MIRDMIKQYDIGFEEALQKTIAHLAPLPPVDLPIDKAGGLATAETCFAVVDSPSLTTSLKDGFAVVSSSIKNASRKRPVRLKIAGMVAAGHESHSCVEPGTAIKVMTGACIPEGANAVIAEEFTRQENGWVTCLLDAAPGRNILTRGSDVERGRTIVDRREILTPALTGFLAAGGIHTIRVHPRPRAGIISTGDEVVMPGRSLKPGQLYASNLVTLVSWLRHFRMEAEATVVPDEREDIRKAITDMLKHTDVLLTSGGAWKSERDLTSGILAEMGSEVIFHRVRLGPGKAVALMLLAGKPVFCLPGGPPSNEMAFLQLALPGLLHMAGIPPVPFGTVTARLSSPVGGDRTWTQFFQARLEKKEGRFRVDPLKMKSRLQSQARAEALIKVPEGVERLNEGEEIQVQVLF